MSHFKILTMSPKEKALDLIIKINNQKISVEQFKEASHYARYDLKRKAQIIVDEILLVLNEIDNTDETTESYHMSIFFNIVKTEIKKL